MLQFQLDFCVECSRALLQNGQECPVQASKNIVGVSWVQFRKSFLGFSRHVSLKKVVCIERERDADLLCDAVSSGRVFQVRDERTVDASPTSPTVKIASILKSRASRIRTWYKLYTVSCCGVVFYYVLKYPSRTHEIISWTFENTFVSFDQLCETNPMIGQGSVSNWLSLPGGWDALWWHFQLWPWWWQTQGSSQWCPEECLLRLVSRMHGFEQAI